MVMLGVGLAAATFMAIVSVSPVELSVTVIIAFPAASAVTKPVYVSIDTVVWSEDIHHIAGLVEVLAGVLVSVVVWPTVRLIGPV